MPERAVACPACKTVHRFEDVVPRRAGCERCGAALHCCLICAFHDPSAYNECSEPGAERVVDKQAENFCDYFRPGAANGTSAPAPESAAMSDLDKLFRKS